MKVFFTRMRSKDACPPRLPLKKILWSWLGAFLGMYLLGALGASLGDAGIGQLFIIGSFGASAVLIYGAPLAEFSQPRNLIGGHLVSALVGVAVFTLWGDNSMLASALAVSCAIAAMHLTRTLHPPGGATALIAVIGGEPIHAMGFNYVLSPVLTGASLLLLVALLVNNLSRDPKRHYPNYWL